MRGVLPSSRTLQLSHVNVCRIDIATVSFTRDCGVIFACILHHWSIVCFCIRPVWYSHKEHVSHCTIRTSVTLHMKKLQLIQLAKHNNGAGSTVYVKGGFHLFKTGKDHALNLLRDSQTPNAKLLLVKDDVYLVIIRDVITTDEITISYENNMSF